MKGQDQTTTKDLSKNEYNVPDREFKVRIMKGHLGGSVS